MLTLDLEEERATSFTALELSEENAVAITKWNQIQVEFPNPINKQRFVIRPKGVAGLIPVSDSLMLRVAPKVPVQNVFGMLELVHGVELTLGVGQVGALGSVDQIFDSVARIFADRVTARVRRGLYSAYIEERETSHVVRGRLDVAATVAGGWRGDSRATCSFEARTPDIDDNQILLWALDRIARVGLRTARALEVVRTARRSLLGTVTLQEKSSKDCRNRSYNRLNEDYRPLHALAKFFLEAMGPRLTVGEHHFVPFTINMWSLFQEFIVASIRSNLPPGLILQRQHPVDLGGVFDPFKIDAVIIDGRNGDVIAVIDAKYKRDLRPASGDVNQIIAYATYTGAKFAVLVYPIDVAATPTTTPSGIRLCTLGLPLERDLVASGKLLCDQLIDLVSK